MTAAAVAAILAFGAGLVEGLARGGGVACVAEAAIAGFVWWTIVLVVIGGAHGLARLLPASARGRWPLALAVAAAVFVATEFAAARALADRFRDPTLVAVATAAVGVVIAWVCVGVVVPLVVRVEAVASRVAPRLRTRWLVGVGLVIGLGGAAALVRLATQERVERPRSGVVVRSIALAEAITDIDGDGDGLVLPPRDCAPLSAHIDGRRCAGQ